MSAFEQQFAKVFSAKEAFSFWKARVALYALLKAMHIGKGDEVILPGYTCVMDVNPIMYVGAKPIYVDIEPVTFNMNVSLLEAAITPDTKVILAQHTYGYPCHMDEIFAIANKHHIPVVEDCCLAFGSEYKGKLCGTFGKAAYFSFQWNKPFTTGLGGMAVAYDEMLAYRLRDLCKKEMQRPSFKAEFMLRVQRTIYNTIIYPKTTAVIANIFRWLAKKGLVVGSSSLAELRPKMADDFFMGMGQSQALVGLKKLLKVDKNIDHRRKMAMLYNQLLREADFDIPLIPEYMKPSLVRYPLRVSDKNKALEMAPAAKVEIGSWFECPLHPIETQMNLYNYSDGQCPEAEKASKETINLPLHPRADEATVRRTVEFIKQFKP